MRKQKGFSLIELLIVVAIILIIAAIAIPNLLRAKIAANESSAVGSIRNVITQEIAYATTYNSQGYSPAISNLAPPSDACPASGPSSTNACLIDAVLGGTCTTCTAANKSGYGFAELGYIVGGGATLPNTGFSVAGAPITYNSSGTRQFCAFEDGVLRENPPAAGNGGGVATAAGLATAAASTTCTTAPWQVVQ